MQVRRFLWSPGLRRSLSAREGSPAPGSPAACRIYSQTMLRRCLLLTGLLGSACTSVRTFEMSWEIQNGPGECGGPGIEPAYANEQRIKLRYVKAPNHYKVICSNRLAQALVAGGKPLVLLRERRNGGRGSSISICEIAGITADAPGTTCTFAGQVSGGFEQNAAPTPWD